MPLLHIMTKTIIVTGGCGYIGSHIARAFKQDDSEHHVYTIDNVRRNHTLRNINGFLSDDYAGDAAIALYQGSQSDVIVHCAGTSLVGPSILDPSEYWANNVTKTITMLNSLKKLKKKPLVLFSSSASVYGNANYNGAITEDQSVNPISPYGNTKATIERILHDYWVAYGIPSVSFRFFNAAGASETAELGQAEGATHIVARLIDASINGRAFTINGDDFDTVDGTCVRDYIHVSDIASAHIAAIKYSESNPGAHIFNLGTGLGISNKTVVDYVNDNYGLKFVKYGDRRDGDPAALVANSTRAQSELGWTPNYSSLQTIVDTAYKWYTRA